MTQYKALLGFFVFTALAGAQALDPREVLSAVEARGPRFKAISRQIWENPELGWHERASSALLSDELRANGFRITTGVAGIPTAFIAEWGSGQPVVGIVGEYDALPGLSQQDSPERNPRVAGAPGHGCGHNLLGSASALAAVAVKDVLAARGLSGTVRFYGTPAEESGAGKVYMVRAGAFTGAGAILAWHPYDRNMADDNPWLANVSARIRFYGKAAHAAAAPEAGRSALDGLEVMTHAVNLLREHVPQETRMHYIITSGGAAANIVPDFAELSIIVRHPDLATLKGIWGRVQDCARAGALATGTRVEIEVVSAYANLRANPVLRDLLEKNLRTAGGVTYTAEEQAFAARIRSTVDLPSLPPADLGSRILPPSTALLSASTDLGDISWVAPTGHLLAAAFPPGTPLHSWQSTACAGTEIGRKGMMVAARTLALTAVDLFRDPSLVDQARRAFDDDMRGREYESLLPAAARPPIPAPR